MLQVLYQVVTRLLWKCVVPILSLNLLARWWVKAEYWL